MSCRHILSQRISVQNERCQFFVFGVMSRIETERRRTQTWIEMTVFSTKQRENVCFYPNFRRRKKPLSLDQNGLMLNILAEILLTRMIRADRNQRFNRFRRLDGRSILNQRKEKKFLGSEFLFLFFEVRRVFGFLRTNLFDVKNEAWLSLNLTFASNRRRFNSERRSSRPENFYRRKRKIFRFFSLFR